MEYNALGMIETKGLVGAIEAGDAAAILVGDGARRPTDAAAEVDPVDRAVLEARLDLAQGEPMAALRSLAQAKERWAEDGRVYAAEAEIFAYFEAIHYHVD